MAARDQRNLWEHHDRLYKQTWGAVETYVPKRVDGRKGVVGLSCSSGRDSKYISFLQCFKYRREVPSTMPMKRTLLWWTFSLEAQLPLVKILCSAKQTILYFTLFLRVWEISKNDLSWLHRQLGRSLWSLPWHQLCVSCWDRILVHNTSFWELSQETPLS